MQPTDPIHNGKSWQTSLHDANKTRKCCYNYDLQEKACINCSKPLALRQAYTSDLEYLTLVEFIYIGNGTIRVSMPFGIMDAL